MTTIKDAALSLRETVSCIDIIATMTNVQLRETHVQYEGACPVCGDGGKGAKSDRFYIRKRDGLCACRKCHPKHMDAVGLVAWLQKVTMHEAVDILAGRTAYNRVAPPPSRPATPKTDENDAYNPAWRQNAAQIAQRNHERLIEDFTGAGAARSYLLSRGLRPETWQAFTVGYDRRPVPGNKDAGAVACVSWPICHESDASVYGMKYRYLEAQSVPGRDAPLRYTSLGGTRTVDRLFGAQLLFADRTAHLRALVICEGEINAMSIYQASNLAGVDVLSFGSESQNRLPAWAIELAQRYGCVITWLDDAGKSSEVATQLRHLTHVTALRSPMRDGRKLDANVMLVEGKLGALVTSVRLRSLPPDKRKGAIHDLWFVREELDAAQVTVAQKAAQELQVAW